MRQLWSTWSWSAVTDFAITSPYYANMTRWLVRILFIVMRQRVLPAIAHSETDPIFFAMLTNWLFAGKKQSVLENRPIFAQVNENQFRTENTNGRFHFLFLCEYRYIFSVLATDHLLALPSSLFLSCLDKFLCLIGEISPQNYSLFSKCTTGCFTISHFDLHCRQRFYSSCIQREVKRDYLSEVPSEK